MQREGREIRFSAPRLSYKPEQDLAKSKRLSSKVIFTSNKGTFWVSILDIDLNLQVISGLPTADSRFTPTIMHEECSKLVC